MKDPYAVVKTVRVTEKGTAQTESLNQYQVVVDKHANKVDVKRAVEQLFKVKVLRVNTMHVRGKARRNTERFANERGVATITVGTLYDAKAHFGR